MLACILPTPLLHALLLATILRATTQHPSSSEQCIKKRLMPRTDLLFQTTCHLGTPAGLAVRREVAAGKHRRDGWSGIKACHQKWSLCRRGGGAGRPAGMLWLFCQGSESQSSIHLSGLIIQEDSVHAASQSYCDAVIRHPCLTVRIHAGALFPGVSVPHGHHRTLCHSHPQEQGGLLDSLCLQWPAAGVLFQVRPKSCHSPALQGSACFMAGHDLEHVRAAHYCWLLDMFGSACSLCCRLQPVALFQVS